MKLKKRKLLNGKEVQELDQPTTLIIHTKCPEKWKLIDMQTGQCYTGTTNSKLYKHWKEHDKEE